MHKAAFVNIIGQPNVGKSTLVNEIVGQPISIVTHKRQTTRHNILGILSGDDYQLIFCDTPGIIQPLYALHESMMRGLARAMQGADVVLGLASLDPKERKSIDFIINYCKNIKLPTGIVLNKVDLSTQEHAMEIFDKIKAELPQVDVFIISALHKYNVSSLVQFALKFAPEHPPYFDKDISSNKNMRFIVAEKIREQIFLRFKQEIPYSTEVVIDSYKDEPQLVRISAQIIVERDSQKIILIGSKGLALKQVATAARKNIENFIKKKVFLEVFVKTVANWRQDKNFLEGHEYE